MDKNKWSHRLYEIDNIDNILKYFKVVLILDRFSLVISLQNIILACLRRNTISKKCFNTSTVFPGFYAVKY